jgi:hypothetical protein
MEILGFDSGQPHPRYSSAVAAARAALLRAVVLAPRNPGTTATDW